MALAAVLVSCAAIRAQAADSLTLRWDPNPPDDQVLGYMLYVGEVSRVYPEVFDVGNQSSFIYPNAVAGQKYFFAVAAYDAAGIGPLSSEVSAAFPIPPSLVNPGDQINALGQTVALQLVGTDLHGGPVGYTASGLPPGLTLAGSTGLISGVGTTVGIYGVTVTATSGLLSATQSFTWVIDGGPPTVAITSPTTAATYSTQDATITLEGTAGDDLDVVAVAWASNQGGEGAATGTTTWSVSTLPLKAGPNVIAITVRDVAGKTATATISVTSPGTPPPTVTITLPTSAPTYATSSTTIAMGGSASDGIGVTSVTWANDRDGNGRAFANPGQSTSWSKPDLRLLPGVNVITVTAWNASGNSSSAVLTVNRANNPPTLVNPGNRTNAENDVVSLQLAGGDPDGDPLTYTITGLPPGLTLNPSSGLISGTLLYTAAGVYSTTPGVSDGLSTTYALLTWTVTNTPKPIMPIVIAANKPYDGTTGATLASCTLSGFASPGLVASYSFDEGPGTTVVDWSGYRNHGSVVNATWTAAGRYGGALLFNGTSARVTIPDAPSLHLTTAMTLESWVRPTTGLSGFQDVIYKGNDNYFLSASSNNNGRPEAGGAFGSNDLLEVFGTTSLTANTWTHLAATYNGVTMRFYVNGVEVSSRARTGSLITSDYPLEIAGDSLYGQYFAGIVDEVRVYNVALTPAQIQADMNLVGADPIGCAGVATFDSPSVGEAKTVTVTNLALTGPAAAEFTLAATTATTAAAILPRTVTAVVTAADKVYDGTTGATLANCTVSGMVGTEAVGCIGTATFGTASAGAGKAVTVTNLALTGADAGNYRLAATSAITAAGIQPLTVTPTVTVANKRYDGTIGATVTSCTAIGVVACTGTATFDSAGVGTGKTVTVTNLALTGANAGNYVLATTTTTATATIYLNLAPVVTNPGTLGSFQGMSVTQAITAIDPDGDSLTFSAANLPPGLAINPSTGVLSGTPTTVGTFAVIISAWDGTATGQASFSWSIISLLPTAATPVSPSGSIATNTPAFSWTADGSATYYALSVSDASAGSPTITWYTPSAAQCPFGGTCTAAAPKSLASGLVTWAVITWNPFGYSPWSITKNAVVDVADPAVPTPVPGAPSGPIATRTPTYTWAAISGGATWYQLSVTDALGVVREFWYSPSQACVTAPCAVTPNVLLAIGSAQWKVRAWRTSGAGAWTVPVTFDAADSAPGTATLLSPLNPVTTVTPSFTWNAVLGTSYYLLRVTDRDNVTTDRWYLPAAAECPLGTGVCVTSPGISLRAGAATWKVLTWNGSGYGPWSATREFLVAIADPAALTPAVVSPTEPIVSTDVIYRWNAVAGALSYRLSIRNNGGAPVYFWYAPAEAGCDATADCSVASHVALLNGTAEWQVQVWTTTGYGPWSPPISLTVDIPAPLAPILISPNGAAGSASPSFRWNASANVALYYIRASDATGLRIEKWLAPSQVGCASGGVCTLDAGVTLTSGAGSWQVIAWNLSGYSAWSSPLAFVAP